MTGRRLLLAVGLWLPILALALAVTIAGLRLGAREWANGHPADLGAILLCEGYLALLGALAIAFGGPQGMRDRLGFRFTSLTDLALAWSAWIAALVTGLLATAALSPLLGQPRSNAVDVLRISFDPLFVALVVPTVCLLAPAAEELLFRGALFGWLRRRLPLAWAVLLSAAVFAGLHLLPPLLPFLFAFGVAAALIYQRTGSTLNSFVMHASQNTVAVAAAYVALTHGQAA